MYKPKRIPSTIFHILLKWSEQNQFLFLFVQKNVCFISFLAVLKDVIMKSAGDILSFVQ